MTDKWDNHLQLFVFQSCWWILTILGACNFLHLRFFGTTNNNQFYVVYCANFLETGLQNSEFKKVIDRLTFWVLDPVVYTCPSLNFSNKLLIVTCSNSKRRQSRVQSKFKWLSGTLLRKVYQWSQLAIPNLKRNLTSSLCNCSILIR